MKRIAILLFALVLCLSACSQAGSSTNDVGTSSNSESSTTNESSVNNVSSEDSSTTDTSDKNDVENLDLPKTSPIFDLYNISDDCPVEVTEYTGGALTVKNNSDEDITSIKIYIAAVDKNGDFIPVKSLLSTGTYAVISTSSTLRANESTTIMVTGNVPSATDMAAFDAIVCSYSTKSGAYTNEHAQEWESICIGMIPDEKEPKEPDFADDCALYKLRALNDTSKVKVTDVDINGGNFLFAIKNESGSKASSVSVLMYAVDENGKCIELVKNSPYAIISLFSSVDDGATMYGSFAFADIDKVAGYVAVVKEYKDANGTAVKNSIEKEWSDICLAEWQK